MSRGFPTLREQGSRAPQLVFPGLLKHSARYAQSYLPNWREVRVTGTVHKFSWGCIGKPCGFFPGFLASDIVRDLAMDLLLWLHLIEG